MVTFTSQISIFNTQTPVFEKLLLLVPVGNELRNGLRLFLVFFLCHKFAQLLQRVMLLRPQGYINEAGVARLLNKL